MAGKPNKKWMETMVKKHGSVEKVSEFMARNGRKGGKVITPNGGFGSEVVGSDGLTGSERARIAGARGGRISRRIKTK